MIKNFKLKIKNSEAGITIIEIIVAIFLVSVFSLILIADFPEIQRNFALSGISYKVAQDFRRAQDLGLSAVRLEDYNGDPIIVKGYGVYFDLNEFETKYAIYADVGGVNAGDEADQKYNGDLSSPLYCSNQVVPVLEDCVIEIIDVSKDNKDLYIKDLENIGDPKVTSINFSPPLPIINIENRYPSDSTEIIIVLGLKNGRDRGVLVNMSGLISVQ